MRRSTGSHTSKPSLGGYKRSLEKNWWIPRKEKEKDEPGNPGTEMGEDEFQTSVRMLK